MFQKLVHAIGVVTCVSALVFPAVAHADQRDRIQHIVDDLKAQLAIPETVSVTIVETNPKLFSVEPHNGERRTFLLSAQEDFAQALTDAELEAAVAHELGHVWIYTHFPYLQTEELANTIASRVISRDTLTPLYDKVWKKAAAD